MDSKDTKVDEIEFSESKSPTSNSTTIDQGFDGGGFMTRYEEVRYGDTVAGIALRTGISVSTLKRLNRLFGNNVYVGQILYLSNHEYQEKMKSTFENNQYSIDLSTIKLNGDENNSDLETSPSLGLSSVRLKEIKKQQSAISSQRNAGSNNIISQVKNNLWNAWWGKNPAGKKPAIITVSNKSSMKTKNNNNKNKEEVKRQVSSDKNLSNKKLVDDPHDPLDASRYDSNDNDSLALLSNNDNSSSGNNEDIDSETKESTFENNISTKNNQLSDKMSISSHSGISTHSKTQSLKLLDHSLKYNSIPTSPSASLKIDELSPSSQLHVDNIINETDILDDLEFLHSEALRMDRESDIRPPRMIGDWKILCPGFAAQLVFKLPVTLQYDTWTLVYSMLENGTDLSTFYSKVKGFRSSIIIIETGNNEIFGGFVDVEWQASPNFYGCGECFLFRCDYGVVTCFTWTQINEFLVWSNTENIAMGGGGGGFGFVLDSDFMRGSTNTCETFANPPLVSKDPNGFAVTNVEVWGFASSFSANKNASSKDNYLPISLFASEKYSLRR